MLSINLSIKDGFFNNMCLQIIKFLKHTITSKIKLALYWKICILTCIKTESRCKLPVCDKEDNFP